MPKLSFFQLTKVFVAGFIGYEVLVSLVIVGSAAVFPEYVKGRFDLSIRNYLEIMSIYFGLFGLIATPLMLLGAWCILRIRRQRDSVDGDA